MKTTEELKNLLYKNETVADAAPDAIAAAQDFCEGYKTFLDEAKTERDAVKEIAANMGAGMGSSITITDDAGSQLLSDLGRSAIQGVSQYVSKKMRSVKVTLKAGYSVLLLPPLQ